MISRREFMQGAIGCALAFAAPKLVAPSPDPHEVVWARSSLYSGALVKIAPQKMADWLADERRGLEAEASATYGRPIAFEAIDEDGQVLRRDPGVDGVYVLWRERLDAHPYWGPKMAALP